MQTAPPASGRRALLRGTTGVPCCAQGALAAVTGGPRRAGSPRLGRHGGGSDSLGGDLRRLARPGGLSPGGLPSLRRRAAYSSPSGALAASIAPWPGDCSPRRTCGASSRGGQSPSWGPDDASEAKLGRAAPEWRRRRGPHHPRGVADRGHPGDGGGGAAARGAGGPGHAGRRGGGALGGGGRGPAEAAAAHGGVRRAAGCGPGLRAGGRVPARAHVSADCRRDGARRRADHGVRHGGPGLAAAVRVAHAAARGQRGRCGGGGHRRDRRAGADGSAVPAHRRAAGYRRGRGVLPGLGLVPAGHPPAGAGAGTA